jgi:hypothetical protein
MDPATMAALLVGRAEVAPNLCINDWLIAQSYIESVYAPCDSQNPDTPVAYPKEFTIGR